MKLDNLLLLDNGQKNDCINMYLDWKRDNELPFMVQTGRTKTFEDHLDELQVCKSCDVVNHDDHMEWVDKHDRFECEYCREEL